MTAPPRCIARHSTLTAEQQQFYDTHGHLDLDGHTCTAAQQPTPGPHREQCTNPALWMVEMEIPGTSIVLGLQLCEADLVPLFEAAPVTMRRTFSARLTDDDGRPSEHSMFAAMACTGDMGTPAHFHPDHEGWRQGRLVEDLGLNAAVYSTPADGVLHMVEERTTVRLYPIADTDAAAPDADTSSATAAP
jgi:hypothetical protein